MNNRVLIVDKDVRARGFLYDLISEVGFDAITLPTGSRVVEYLKNDRPAAIIISDISQKHEGMRLAKVIRDFDRDVKIIILGCRSLTEDEKKEFYRAGVNIYLEKDFSNLGVIKEVLCVLKQRNDTEPLTDKKRGRVLIVDDEKQSCDMIGNFLWRRGYEIDYAYSGEEALAKIKQKVFDVVLLDIAMHNMDGLLVLKHLQESGQETKVIMVTAVQDEEVIEEARALGACDYIVKPFDLNALESSILSVLLVSKSKK